jgi:hypothetical protein
MRRRLLSMAAIVGLLAAAPTSSYAVTANDYPTEVIADYVIGCMASNGENQDMLRRCSCSIDAVTSIVPYDVYEKADTIIRMRMVSGDMTAMFRDMKMLDDTVKQLRLAQIEADFRCF